MRSHDPYSDPSGCQNKWNLVANVRGIMAWCHQTNNFLHIIPMKIKGNMNYKIIGI